MMMTLLTRMSKWFVVVTLTLSLGAHWTFLQSVAWVGMMVNYSQNATLGEAFSKTFDGQHPCKLCKFVQAGKASEKKQNAEKPKKELDKNLPVARAFALYPPGLQPLIFGAPNSADFRAEPPPIPPPEGA